MPTRTWIDPTMKGDNPVDIPKGGQEPGNNPQGNKESSYHSPGIQGPSHNQGTNILGEQESPRARPNETQQRVNAEVHEKLLVRRQETAQALEQKLLQNPGTQ